MTVQNDGAADARAELARCWHEDGADNWYSNRCTGCQQIFYGHKRRCVCKVCHDKAASPPVLPLGWLDEAMKLADLYSRSAAARATAHGPTEYARADCRWEEARAALRTHLEVRGTAEPYTGEPK